MVPEAIRKKLEPMHFRQWGIKSEAKTGPGGPILAGDQFLRDRPIKPLVVICADFAVCTLQNEKEWCLNISFLRRLVH